MTSLLDVRLGAQVPVVHHLPPDVVSLAAAEETIELADAYGICDGFPLAESQKITLRGALGERANGSWAASRVADFGPRQGTGKNDKIAARELAGLILFGERLQIHTAHEFPTANESFLRLVAIFENYDDLRKKVKHIYYANGAQSIELLSGQRLLYKTRTGGAGRGFAKADLVVYDEAQHLRAEHVAASGPAKLANPNSQTWYAGSGGLETSSVAWAIRRSAILGTGGRLAYTEMTGETITVVDGKIRTAAPDPDDVVVWYRAMPGLGRWITEEGVLALREELGDLFPREGLCVWDPELGTEGSTVIPADKWDECLTGPAEQVGRPVFAVDVSPDRSTAAIGVAFWREDGLPQVEVAAQGEGTGWIVPWFVERKKNRARRLVDPAGPAGSLLSEAEAAGVPLEVVTSREHAQACGMFYDDVLNGRLRHLDSPALATALAGADRRPSGEAWLWSRKASTADITPLVAVTLARWALGAKKKAQVVDLAAVLAEIDEEGS